MKITGQTFIPNINTPPTHPVGGSTLTPANTATKTQPPSVTVTINQRFEGLIKINEMISESFGNSYKGSGELRAAAKFYHDVLSDKDWDDFVSAALMSGEDIDTFLVTAKGIFGENGGSQENLSSFLTFSAGLLETDLNHFLETIENAPGELTTTMETASKLSQTALSHYLEAASFSEDDLDLFNERINDAIQKTENPDSLDNYLAAAVKAGSRVLDFVDATSFMKEAQRNQISDFVHTQIQGRDLDNFIEFISLAGKDAITRVSQYAVSMNEDDKTNLLKAAVNAAQIEDKFIQTLDRMAQNQPDKLSDFLTSATHSEMQMDTLLDMAGQIDFEFVSSLSVVDTVNYLEAAKSSGSTLEKLTQTASSLSGQEKSLFLYGAAKNVTDFDRFLTSVESMNGAERNSYLLGVANQDQENVDELIYMKGLLTSGNYKNFKSAAAQLNDDQLKEFTSATNNIDRQNRSDFLAATAAAKEVMTPFLAMFENLSHGDQTALLQISSDLGKENRSLFIQGALKSQSDVSNYIKLSEELKTSDGAGQMLNDFISASVHASNPDELSEMISFVEKLKKGQQKSFLSAASQERFNISQLIDLGEQILSYEQSSDFFLRKRSADFSDVFFSIAANAADVVGLFM
ncbi:MAG: hypothetical protein GY729_22235, partial [Desulfobacteraceae bacterium]|nr:hypothetical protein [Desulfobacteraceae bacterium]